MEIVDCFFNDVYVLKPKIFEDQRGYFYESFNQKTFEKLTGATIDFVQDNQSSSKKNIVRGLHFQIPPHSQAKLIQVIKGRVLDVFVDLRKNSADYGKWHAVELSGENHLQVFIPKGFAHGFVALEDETLLVYKCSDFYNKASEISIRFDDPDLNIDWKIDINNIVLSEKDKNGIFFNEFVSPF